MGHLIVHFVALDVADQKLVIRSIRKTQYFLRFEASRGQNTCFLLNKNSRFCDFLIQIHIFLLKSCTNYVTFTQFSLQT